MKKEYRIVICWLSIVFWGISCQSNQSIPESPPENVDMDCFNHYYPSYVYSYHNADSMYLEMEETYTLRIMFKSSNYITYELDKIRYDSLSMKHNDTAYNSWIKCHWQPFFPHNYLAFDLLSITINSNADFDVQHLAGTSLNDLVYFTAYTPYPFILTGYEINNTQDYYYARLENELTFVSKPLSQCTQDDFILILGQKDNEVLGDFPSFSLVIKEKPTLAQQHTITVTILDDAGKTWQASIDMDWSGQ